MRDNTVELVSPDRALCDSYRELVSEFIERREPLVPFVLQFDHRDCDAMLARFDDCSRGIGLPAGFVAHSTYWLIAADRQVIGVSNIRHSLTPALRREGGNIGYGVRPGARGRGHGVAILRLSLSRAAGLGLREVLLTCGKANVRSAKVIRANGGTLDSEEYLPERGEIVQRYHIPVVAGSDTEHAIASLTRL
jgi:predicted acetyltransferase